MAKTQTLTFKETIQTTPANVYRLFTNSTALRGWFSDVASTDARKGGRFYAAWNGGFYAAGEFTNLVPDKKVAFTWIGKDEPAPTKVQVTIAQKKGGVTVTVAQSGVGSGKTWAKAIKEMEAGWKLSLRNLKAALETGEDLRLTMRPMLGIMPGAFDAKIAKELNVPVTEGVKLDGTVDGMGAQACGLLAGDVIVSIGGKKVTATTLAPAIQNRQAGDKVAVKFYRGSKLNTVTMELSKRPLAPTPTSGAELAKHVAAMYAELDAELEKCFEGVTEAEASYKASPVAWSAKDVVCHLLTGERDAHSFIAEAIQGYQRSYDGFGDNLNERHAALMSVLPTYRQLLDEYQRAEAETIAFLKLVPDGMVARKSEWWTFCFGYLQPPLHNHAHFEQIREAIAKARSKT